VGIVSDGRELRAAAKSLAPDVILVDISMPSLNCIEDDRRMRAAEFRAKVVFLTMHREVTYAARALEAGASGFVLNFSAPVLLTPIEDALTGGT
jgi:DNA-binding NarL/FixJ family response regulator